MTQPPSSEVREKAPLLAHDGLLWRRLARLGASRGPRWFVEYSPSLIGLCAAALLPSARRAVSDNLRQIRGPVGTLREARDVAETFATYAGCLAEALSAGSKNAELPHLEVRGAACLEAAVAAGRGVILATAHTAGWELVGPVLRDRGGPELVMVMEPERDRAARELHDRARRANGVAVAHVGDDPLASLALLRRLREGAALGVQIDRVPAGMRGICVRLFGRPGMIPEGPLRLAEASGAPIVPVFCARLGHRRYFVDIADALNLPRRSSQETVATVAQRLADAMTDFVRLHPTQWFDFRSRGGNGGGR
jgi:KDO2-lipid IV(A) lauroyltransferase